MQNAKETSLKMSKLWQGTVKCGSGKMYTLYIWARVRALVCMSDIVIVSVHSRKTHTHLQPLHIHSV